MTVMIQGRETHIVSEKSASIHGALALRNFHRWLNDCRVSQLSYSWRAWHSLAHFPFFVGTFADFLTCFFSGLLS